MQSGLGRPGARAARVGVQRRFGTVGVLLEVLLLGLAVSACASSGQIASLTETRRTTIAFESIDGPPPAVFSRFVTSLKQEAGARQIAVVPSKEANYRLRGYLAAQGGDTISWALDVYDADQRRAFRLSGEEKTAGRMWAGADDQVLQRIARAGMTQFAAFVSNARTAADTPPPAPRRSSTTLAWIDNWTPEASGIFRIFRGDPARAPEIAADAGAPLPADQVPLPRGRPVPDGAPSGSGAASVLAFAAADHE
jgi:hypothetical protein